MIDREHDLPIAKQAKALNISRGSVYYLPRPVSAADLATIMRRIDELHLEFPFAGSRMLKGLLAAEGCKIGRRHVKTLMRRMGIEALYRRPRTATSPSLGTRFIPICCAASRSCGRTRRGRWTSPTSRWRAAFRAPTGTSPTQAQQSAADMQTNRAEIGRIFTVDCGAAPTSLLATARISLRSWRRAPARPKPTREAGERGVTQAKQATDVARKAAAKLALWLAASMLAGAFAASLAATAGGVYRDERWYEAGWRPSATF